MNLMKRTESWDPFDLLSDVQHDLNRVFDRSLRGQNGWTRSFRPDLEVREEKDRFVVHADLPGMKKEDLSISVEGTYLTLRGERKEETESKEKGYRYSERFFGTFSRTIELPTEIDAQKVKAAYKDGVLEIQLPKSESAKPKQIDIEVK